SAEYQREFVEAACGLLENRERMMEMSEAAKSRAFGRYTWAGIASEWTSIFENMPSQTVHGRWAGPLTLLQKTHGYLESGNVNAARRVLVTLDQTPFLRNEIDALWAVISQ
ncbi:MAG: glycosyltransferase, partial [Acidobacteria bacterium]|nr:glycosyltransferase [Acidobacteriota bacterium]